MKRSNKKGFTIIELVVVVAVIAVLSAVLIPTFTGVIRRANVSSDTVLVRNLNTAVSAEVEKPETMQEALDVAFEAGYDVAKITTKAEDNEILWDNLNKCFVYVNDGKLTWIPNTKVNEPANVDLWTISNVVDAKYSTYLYGYNGASEITTSKGLDVGTANVSKITYQNSGAAQSVIIVTNNVGTEVVVNAANDNVTHYGAAGAVNVKAVAKNSYHENGAVQTITVEAGRVVVEKAAVVNQVVVAPKAAEEVKVEVKVVEVEEAPTVYAVEGATGVTFEGVAEEKKVEVESVEEIEEVVAAAQIYAGGMGTEANPYLIATAEQFMNIGENDLELAMYKLTNDIDVANVDLMLAPAQGVGLDLNGYAINNVHTRIFNAMDMLAVANGTINFVSTKDAPTNKIGVLGTLNNVSGATAAFVNLTLTGNIYTTSTHYGPLVSYAYGMNDTVAAPLETAYVVAQNVVNNANIYSDNANVGGLFGYVQGNNVAIVLQNCEFNGTIASKYAAGFVNNCTYPNATAPVVSGLTVNGNVVGSDSAMAAGFSANLTGGQAKVNELNGGVNVTGSVVKSAVENAMITVVENEFVVVASANTAVVRYSVQFEFMVEKPGETGGYNRGFVVELDEAGATGIYNYRIEEVDADASTPETLVFEQNNLKMWVEDGMYKVYDATCDYYVTSGVYAWVTVTGYNANNAPVVTATYSVR